MPTEEPPETRINSSVADASRGFYHVEKLILQHLDANRQHSVAAQ